MLDITLLRKDLDSVIARLEARKSPQPYLDVDAFQALEAERKTIQTRTEELQARRNQLSKQIGQLKAKGESADAVMAEVAAHQGRARQLGRSGWSRSSPRCRPCCCPSPTCRTRACRSAPTSTATCRCASGARRASSTSR